MIQVFCLTCRTTTTAANLPAADAAEEPHRRVGCRGFRYRAIRSSE